jgi:hypothetical protein
MLIWLERSLEPQVVVNYFFPSTIGVFREHVASLDRPKRGFAVLGKLIV